MFCKTMFHTQEARKIKLTQPIRCTRNDAWLGHAYYFWRDEEDAREWGRKSKNKVGFYDIYSADIKSDNILDTVFNEEHYNFWVASIDQALQEFVRLANYKPDREFLCDFIMNEVQWDASLDGLLFADSPFTAITGINYRKRIQLALYNIKCLSNFRLKETGKC